MRKGRESFTQVAEITGVHEMSEQILSKSNKHSLKLFSKEGIEWLEKRHASGKCFGHRKINEYTRSRGAMDTTFFNNEVCNTLFVEHAGIELGMDAK